MFDINSSPLMQLVFSCKASGHTEDAKTLLEIASKHCFGLDLLDQIAYLQNEVKDYKGSVESLRKCMTLTDNPEQCYAIRANLAKIYNHLNEPRLSIGYSNVNLNISQGRDYDTLMEIAFSHYLLGDYVTSERMMRELSASEIPDNIRGRVEYNLGSYDIEAGNFKKGLRGFIDVGHKIGIWHHRELPDIPQWDGQIDPTKCLIVHAEGGIGDEIIGFRFARMVKAMGMDCLWLTGHEDLVSVFGRHGVTTISNRNLPQGGYVQCMAMYLPIILDIDSDRLWTGPYLTADPSFIEKWESVLPEGRKLGVKWSGNPYYDQDLHRSIPLELINGLEFDGTKLNLQLEPDLQQDNMWNLSEVKPTIEDTLAILHLCDNVVTSCTSIAHMCGAMGRDAIVCPPIASYYTWLGLKGIKSDWYGESLKVIRQTEHKNWQSVIDNVQQLLG